MYLSPEADIWLVVLVTMLLPGVGWLRLARLKVNSTSAVRAERLRTWAQRLGWANVGLTGFFTLCVLPSLFDGPGGTSNIAVVLLAALYLFVIAPLSLIASGILGTAYLLAPEGAER